jgi:hypothetical protein
LTIEGRLIWLYLLTSPQTNPIGLYVFSTERAASDLKLSPEPFRKLFVEMLNTMVPDSIQWDEKNLVILIPKWIGYNLPKNPNVVIHWRSHLEGIPEESPLISAWLEHAERYIKPLKKSIVKQFHQSITKQLGKSYRYQEQDQETGSVYILETENSTPPSKQHPFTWDAENGKLVFLSDAERSRAKAKWEGKGYDFETEVVKFEKKHFAKGSQFVDAPRALANWMKKAPASDVLAEAMRDIYYEIWPQYHNNAPIMPNDTDIKAAVKIAKYFRNNWTDSQDVMLDAFRHVVQLFMEDPSQKDHPIGFLAHSLAGYVGRVVTE